MIGIFDSGLGGLIILKEIKRVLPKYDYMYFGDTMHVPYGNRSPEAIYELSKKACDFFFANNCHLIIIACNTASALALRKLQQEYLTAINQASKESNRKNILGVISPMVEEAARISKGKVGIIGTAGTIASNTYVVELNQQNKNLKIVQQACPLLVPMIEEGWIKRKEIKSILRYYLRPLKLAGIDTLVLGCTHYPLLIKQIRGIMGKSCQTPNPGEIVVQSLKNYLARHPDIERNLTKNSKCIYFASDLNENFQKMARQFMDEKIKILLPPDF